MTRMGAALKMDEYVPEVIPTNRATINHLTDSPENNSRANRVNKTVREVDSDLARV